MFHRYYMNYHQDRFEDHSLMIFKEDRLVAVFPANQREKIVQSHGGLSYGGLVYTTTEAYMEPPRWKFCTGHSSASTSTPEA